jgi:hypothetical protein
MIDLEIGFLAFYLLLLIVVAYAWSTRREPAGRHRIPQLTREDSRPYPYDGPLMELSVFPDFDPAPKRLASTGELRQYAYDGNLDAIRQDNTDWTTAA